ncbi:hypothetical protein [Streptomyces longispororuber]|uniref:hypothetical protein n=1 Tax=Streptomyces longispororuber TaxID=68230 RepID=UPI00210A57C3|nr:hypothetical protein [Streptomyces longispororuber]MCQ4214555.1 hypothetical protein [Streptomyces longispororuber]
MDSQKVTPVAGAGFDPAHVPGLTSPGPEAVVEDAVTEPDETPEEVTEAEPEAKAALRKKPAEPDEETDADEPEEPADSADSDDSAETEAAAKGASDGSVSLEAKDRRGSITVDATGVRFTLDDQEADFTWDEISAVEFGTARKRLTVTVHTPNSRWYPNDVEAPDKARLNEWTETLDKALDAYFED